MSVTRDRVLAVGGGLAVALVLGGLVVVEANTGPFPHEVGSAPLDAQLQGTFLVERDGSPTCGPDGASGVCDPPRTEVVLRIEGLPSLGADGAYEAALTSPSDRLSLGTLERASGGHELAYAAEVDGDRYSSLVLEATLPGHRDAEAVPVAEVPLPTSGGEAVELGADLGSLPAEPSGRVDLAQIGAVEVAVTARGTVVGVPGGPAWVPTAWLLDGSSATHLGAMEQVGDGEAEADFREARVVLAEQDRLLVTLEPAGAVDRAQPGLPLADAPVQARSLGSLFG